jgi:hypothetical protein
MPQRILVAYNREMELAKAFANFATRPRERSTSRECQNNCPIECRQECNEFGTISGTLCGKHFGTLGLSNPLISKPFELPAPPEHRPASRGAAETDPSPPTTWVEGSVSAAVIQTS